MHGCRQTVFCTLKPGKYTLNLFAEYPLGGLHPCDSFFLQLALKPVALIKQVEWRREGSGVEFSFCLELVETRLWGWIVGEGYGMCES